MSAEIIPLKPKRAKAYEKVFVNGKEEPYLLRHVASGVYYVRKFKSGRGELFKSTGETGITAARGVRDALIAEFETGVRSPGRKRTVAEVADELFRVLALEAQTVENGRVLRRKRTHDKDKSMMPVIKDLFGNVRVEDIDETWWKAWRRKEGRTLERTLFDVAKYLSKVMTFALEQKYIQRQVRIEIPDTATGKQTIYTDEQVALFYRHACPTLRDLITIEATCGTRVDEARCLRWEWIDLQRGGGVVVNLPAEFTKTGKARSFKLGPQAEDVIRRRHKARVPGSPWVFPGVKKPEDVLTDVQVSRLWRRMLKRAGIAPGPKLRWLRHTFYNKALLDARMPVTHVSQYGGTSIATLQKNYLKNDAERTKHVGEAVTLKLVDEE